MREISLKFDLPKSVATHDGRPESVLSVNPAGSVLNKPTRHTHQPSEPGRSPLSSDTRLQQEIGEPPNIVQQHREHEVEEPHAVILGRRLRQEVVLDALVLVLDLPATAVPTTEPLSFLGAD